MSARASIVPVALASALAAACAGAGAGVRPLPERRAATATPEPDPAARATMRAALQANAIEQVHASVIVDRGGKVVAVKFLTPGLTPAQQLDLRRAFEATPWHPGTGPDGQPADESSTTIVIRVAE